MTKELYDEAVGRPPKERTVLNEVKELLQQKENTEKTSKYHSEQVEKHKTQLRNIVEKLGRIKEGKYVLNESTWKDTGFEVFYSEKEELDEKGKTN